ncbi:MAG: TadE/TadG family type IV pilus assembly protein [Solirubrobacterales bacterium]
MKPWDESGSMALWSVFLLIFVTVALIWLVEAGRIYTIKSNLETAADAASISGAWTATTGGDAPVYDANGEIAEIGGNEVMINKNVADSAAEPLLEANATEDTSDWSSVADNDKYSVKLNGVSVNSMLGNFIGQPVVLKEMSQSQAAVYAGIDAAED